MISDAMEPIFRVPVIGLAAMDDTMEVGAVGVVNLLRDDVGGVEMVVPQKDERANELSLGGLELEVGKNDVECFGDFGLGKDTGAWAGAEFGRIAGRQKLLEMQGSGFGRHGLRLKSE
jgi:hypothetical protein